MKRKMTLSNGVELTVNEWTIGSRHDPYSAKSLSLDIPSLFMHAEMYDDGLGRNRVTVVIADVVMHEREWFYCGGGAESRNKDRCNTTYANLLARKYLGVRFDDAEHEFDERMNKLECRDPYGPPSKYI